MFDWLPEVCREMRGTLVDIYWILLVPYLIFILCLEVVKGEGVPNGGTVLRRVFLSIILLLSFEECLNVLAFLSDGITEKINGVAKLKEILASLGKQFTETESSWLKFREFVFFAINILSYLIAYLGVFVADVIIHLVWSLLYVVSPLMILMFISEKTSFVTKNLYQGLIHVVVWKVLWSILGILFFNLQVALRTNGDPNFFIAVLLNLCIGFGMLYIPLLTRSLLSDGLTSIAAKFATVPANIAIETAKSQFAPPAKNVGSPLPARSYVRPRKDFNKK